MKPITFILILLAFIFSGMATYMARKAIKQNQSDVVRAEMMSGAIDKVLVANRNILVGEVIKSADLRWQDWPKKSISKDFISGGESEQLDYFIGRAAKSNILENEVIVKARTFDPEKTSMMSGIVAPGKRAYGVPISLQSGMTGFISPGDLVDVLLVGRFAGQDLKQQNQKSLVYKNFSETILTNIKVLAVDNEITNLKEKDETAKGKKAAKSLTLEVTPQEAEILAVAQKMGDLTFVLRALTKEENNQPLSKKDFTGDLDASNLLSVMIRGNKAQKDLNKMTTIQSNGNNIKIYRGKEVITQSMGP